MPTGWTPHNILLIGRVARIKPFGEKKHGDMTYTVLIQLDHHDEQLRWNMTAVVNIEP